MELHREKPASSSLWIFGYGSLVWNPGFQYRTARKGFIRGFARRFWQGNIAQRGTAAKPGRVATLVEEAETLTWGKAFELADESSLAALEYLNIRETSLGGYRTHITVFYPGGEEEADTPGLTTVPFPVLLYLATSDNQHYLGPAPAHEMADQITAAAGDCGSNVEYLLRLAEFMHDELPAVYDDHLFTLECLVRLRLKDEKIRMANRGGPDVEEAEGRQEQAEAGAVGGVPEQGEPVRPNNFQFTAKVPPKKLRCLNV